MARQALNWRNIRITPIADWDVGVVKDGFCYWCRAVAVVVVSRTSNVSDRTYNQPCCATCAAEYAPFINAEQVALCYVQEPLPGWEGLTQR